MTHSSEASTPRCAASKAGTRARWKRIVSGIEAQIATLTAYRKSLIHECVTGQRRITEADLNRVESHG